MRIFAHKKLMPFYFVKKIFYFNLVESVLPQCCENMEYATVNDCVKVPYFSSVFLQIAAHQIFCFYQILRS